MKQRLLAVVPLALAACAPLTPLDDDGALAPAARAHATVPLSEPDLLAGFRPRPVVEPSDWRGQNDGQSPVSGGN